MNSGQETQGLVCIWGGSQTSTKRPPNPGEWVTR